MTSLKPFYDGNHFTSKQTEHKTAKNKNFKLQEAKKIFNS
jgi:hypothetical protein